MSLARASRMEDRPFGPRPGLVKGVLDRVVAAVVLLIGAPWIALIALAVWLDSPGPVLSREKRVGQWGETFDLLRFRSTAAVAGEIEERGRPAVAGATRVGRVLRRYSLHELPQLVNVLAGDMSLVGPRPQQHATGGVYGEDLRRLLLKPGLTGLWLSAGDRGASRDVAVRLDDYLQDWSLALDLRILGHAVRTALRGADRP
jgi:lipopolysaccharide/colanic/teichoic acid biosynthesis glycosyltransferase